MLNTAKVIVGLTFLFMGSAAISRTYRAASKGLLFDIDCIQITRDFSYINASVLLMCASACNEYYGCYTFCVQNGICTLYEARVSKFLSSPSADSCYSSWPAYTHIPVVAAGGISQVSWRPLAVPMAAVDDYFCSGLDACFVSDVELGPWWYGDMGSVQGVASVHVWSATYTNEYFEDVEARIGNTTDVTLMTPFAFRAGVLNASIEAIFTPAQPVWGRYLGLVVLSPNWLYFVVCDVHIISV